MLREHPALLAFYANAGIRELIPIYPLYAIMFSEHGVSAFEISLLFVVWAFVGIVAEVPSGALADRFSRKWLIVASGLFKSAAFLSWFAWQSFPGFALGFILWGTGSSLRSGAWEALLHDLLTSWDRKLEFSKHYGRMKSLGTVGVCVGEAAGGALIFLGYDIVLIVSALIPLVATAPFVFLVGDVPVRDDDSQEAASEPDYFRTLRSGVTEAVTNRTILYILLVISLLIVTVGVYDEYVGLTLRENGFSLAVIAYLGIPIYLAQAVGHAIAHRFDAWSSTQSMLLIAATSGTLVLVPFLPDPGIPVVMSLVFFMFGVTSTLFQSYLQAEIEGDARATVTSTVGLGDSLGAIIWFLIFGALAEATSMTDATLMLGVLIVLLAGFFRALAARWRIQR
jgi:MFS family permease